MSKNTRGTEEERAIHREACRLRKMTDKQLVDAFKNAAANSKPDVQELIDGFNKGECPGVKAATAAKITAYAQSKGYI